MISIAMTTYNGEKFIEKQLESILSQTMLPHEIIICDDCSTDKTVEIIKKVINGNDSGIKIKLVENQENLGYVKNFHKAISMTKGKYIFLADQDDIWNKEKIEIMINMMKKTDAVAMCSDFVLIDQNDNRIQEKNQYRINKLILNSKKPLTEIAFLRLLFGNVAQGCTYCFNDDVKKIYLELDNDRVVHDLQIMLIASLIGKVYFYKKELIEYRIHERNAIGFNKKDNAISIEIKKPSRKPFMVEFLNELNEIIKIPLIGFYKLLFYLRIPYFVSKLKK